MSPVRKRAPKMRETARHYPCAKRRFRLNLPEMSQDDQSAPLPPPQPPPTLPSDQAGPAAFAKPIPISYAKSLAIVASFLLNALLFVALLRTWTDSDKNSSRDGGSREAVARTVSMLGSESRSSSGRATGDRWTAPRTLDVGLWKELRSDLLAAGLSAQHADNIITALVHRRFAEKRRQLLDIRREGLLMNEWWWERAARTQAAIDQDQERREFLEQIMPGSDPEPFRFSFTPEAAAKTGAFYGHVKSNPELRSVLGAAENYFSQLEALQDGSPYSALEEAKQQAFTDLENMWDEKIGEGELEEAARRFFFWRATDAPNANTDELLEGLTPAQLKLLLTRFLPENPAAAVYEQSSRLDIWSLSTEDIRVLDGSLGAGWRRWLAKEDPLMEYLGTSTGGSSGIRLADEQILEVAQVRAAFFDDIRAIQKAGISATEQERIERYEQELQAVLGSGPYLRYREQMAVNEELEKAGL